MDSISSRQKQTIVSLAPVTFGHVLQAAIVAQIVGNIELLSTNSGSLSLSPEEQELKSMEVDALIEHAEVITYSMLVQMVEKLNVGKALLLWLNLTLGFSHDTGHARTAIHSCHNGARSAQASLDATSVVEALTRQQ
jgi:hypothetical protein